MCTPLDNGDQIERRTAIIGRKLDDYYINTAALSETRLSEESSMEQLGTGYTFFPEGKPDGVPPTSGVGFAIRTSLARNLDTPACGVSDRIMVLRPK